MDRYILDIVGRRIAPLMGLSAEELYRLKTDLSPEALRKGARGVGCCRGVGRGGGEWIEAVAHRSRSEISAAAPNTDSLTGSCIQTRNIRW